MSDEKEPDTKDEGDDCEEQDWESIGTTDTDDSDCDTVVDLEDLEDMSTTAAEIVMKSVGCQTEDRAAIGAAFMDYDDSIDDVTMEEVELEELLELEKDNAEQDLILGPPSTNDPAIIKTDSAPSTAPFYPPGLIIPNSSSAFELKPFDTFDDFTEYSEVFWDIEPNIIGVPVLMSAAELSQGELWLYGEQYLAQYRCRSPSPLRICWTSIWVQIDRLFGVSDFCSREDVFGDLDTSNQYAAPVEIIFSS